MLRGASLSLAAVLLTTAAAAQEASGVVLGFDGRPAAGAIVSVRFDPGSGTEVLTDTDGGFVVRRDQRITSLVVQLEGVRKSVPVVNGKVKDAEITFVGAPCFTIRGKVKGPDGNPLPMAELLWRDANGSALTNVTTDARGDYVVRLDAPVREVVVDPIGWRHVTSGPFEGARDLDIDLGRADGWFALRGRVLGANGPCGDIVVRAHLDETSVIRVKTRADGGYTVWTKRPVAKLEVGAPVHLRRNGPFQRNGTALDLDDSECGLVVVSGRFVASDGSPISAARLFATKDSAPPAGALPDGGTDHDGTFETLVPRNTRFVHIRDVHTGAAGTAEVTSDRRDIEVRAAR